LDILDHIIRYIDIPHYRYSLIILDSILGISINSYVFISRPYY
jgi:hypothetical protein